MIPEAAKRSPDIYLTVEGSPGKPQLGDRSDEDCATNHRLKWEPLTPNDVGRIIKHFREKREEGKKRTVLPGFNLLSMEPWYVVRGHLPRLSRLLASDKGDNEMIPEAEHRSPVICLTAEEILS